MSKKLLYTLIASLFVTGPALAADQPDSFIVQGEVTAGAITTSTSDTQDAAKLKEYRDLRNGVISDVFVRGRSGNVWFDAWGENFGRDDQSMALRGGMYGTFKYRLYSDSLPHNFLYNGRTPYVGAGGNALIANFPAPNPALWNPVDVGFKRTDNGGYFEWQGLAPWYARVDANEVKFDGNRLSSSSNATSPVQGFVDLILPVQYSTKNATGEIGYNTGRMNLSVSWMTSKFTNNNDILQFTNPFWGNGLDTSYLPPDNKYNRLALQGTFRSLPANSTFAARYTWSELKSDTGLAPYQLNGIGANAYGATNPNVDTFNGKHEDQVLNLTLNSTPLRAVNTRIYYNFQDRNNDSTHVIYDPVAGLNCGGGECENDLFSYRKHNAGIEGYWRFLPGNRVGAGYDYLNKDYEGRPDYDSSRENKAFVEYKNTQLANVSGRLKYTYLERRSDFLWGNLGTTGADAEFLSRFVSAMDLSNLNRDEVKLTLDFTPVQLVDLSLEGTWKQNKYQNITFGRTKDKRYELYGSASFGDFSRFRVTLFGDIEEIKYDANHRYIGAVPCNAASGLLCNDPSQPATGTAYNWSSNTKDRNWMVGAGADLPVNEKLVLKGSVLYSETDGSADFATQCNGSSFFGTGPTANCANFAVPLPITAFDDTKTTSVNLRGIYSLNKNWAFTLGYAYEKFRYTDVSHTGLTYTIPYPGVTNNTSQSYLNGYLANPDYEANIFYALASFRF